MMKDTLMAALREAFAGGSFYTDDQGAVRFAPAHEDVGGLRIWSCGCEITVEVGDITHGQFDCCDEDPGETEREQAAIRAAVAFIADLFAGRVVLWRSDDRLSGGWFYPEESGERADSVYGNSRKFYVWTGPLRGTT